MTYEEAQIVDIALSVTRELVQRHAPGELSLFDRHRDLLRDLYEQLLKVPREQWEGTAGMSARTGLGAIAPGEENSFLLATSKIAAAVAYELLRTGTPVSPVRISQIVTQEAGGLSDELRRETDELWVKGMTGAAVDAAEKGAEGYFVPDGTEPEALGEPREPYVVFEGPNSRPASSKAVADLWDRLDQFTLFIDEPKEGWFYRSPSGIQPIPLQPGSLVWHFLCLALQRVGGYWKRDELRAAFEERIGRQYDSELWQFRQRLNKGTGGVVGSIVQGQPKGGGYRIAPTKTCLIQKMPS